MKLSNFLPLNRDVIDHWVYQDKDYFRVWVHILLSAQYMDREKKMLHNGYWITQNYGDFIFGRSAWSKKLDVSEQRLRTIMKKFEAENMIIKSTSNQRTTVYTVVNYSKFNHRNNQSVNQPEQLECQGLGGIPTSEITTETTSDQPATNQRLTTIKKDNIDKIVKDTSSIAPPDTFIGLVLNDNSQHFVSQSDVSKYKSLYPAVNVEQQLRNMKGWLESNPTKRKTSRGIARFITNWLAKDQDRGGQRVQPGIDGLKGWGL